LIAGDRRPTLGRVSEFVVELYVSREQARELPQRLRRLRDAATALRREGRPVRCRRRIFLPEDEICLLVWEAESADAVHETGQRADLPFVRVTEAAPEVCT
jgi:hypothetical protein